MPRAPVLVLLGLSLTTAVPLGRQKSFGHAIKNGVLPPNTTVITFEHTCSVAPCVITHVNVPSIYPKGGDPWNWTQGLVSFFVDGEAEPSVALTLLELAAEGHWNLAGTNKQAGGHMADGTLPAVHPDYDPRARLCHARQRVLVRHPGPGSTCREARGPGVAGRRALTTAPRAPHGCPEAGAGRPGQRTQRNQRGTGAAAAGCQEQQLLFPGGLHALLPRWCGRRPADLLVQRCRGLLLELFILR